MSSRAVEGRRALMPTHSRSQLQLRGRDGSGGESRAWTRGRDMASARFPDTLASMAAPLLGDLLCFCSLAASHPLLIAYLLFFSPYLLAALSFLGPLLLSTCFLLLALLTVSPYLGGSPPSPPPPPDGGGHSPPAAPPGPFVNTLRLVLDILDPSTDGEPGVPPPGALGDIASELQACVESVEEIYRERGEVAGGANQGWSPGHDGGEGGTEEEAEEEEKRIVAEAAPGSELFGWELEAISKLYKALTYEVEEFPIKLALRSLKEGELFPPSGIGFHGGDRKLQTGVPGEDLPRKEAPCPEFESQDRKVPTCDDSEEVDIPLGNASTSTIKSRDRSELELPARDFTGDDNTSPGPKRVAPKSKGISRSESDGSRSSGELLRRSSSSSSSAPRAPAGAGLSRVTSARDWRWSGSNPGAPPPQALSSSASMRKEKEWRRTLACKLFEERMVADGGEEGMDLLWETYELGSGKDDGGSSRGSSSRGDDKGGRKDSKAKVARRGSVLEQRAQGGGRWGVDEEEEDDEEEEEEETVGRLCCLQALRFSTANMGFGVGRSGLLKVSKAMKGVGVLRRALRSTGRKLGRRE